MKVVTAIANTVWVICWSIPAAIMLGLLAFIFWQGWPWFEIIVAIFLFVGWADDHRTIFKRGKYEDRH